MKILYCSFIAAPLLASFLSMLEGDSRNTCMDERGSVGKNYCEKGEE